jgi:NADPH:quinone reductase-like Zn-dependent oxidoreductase
MRRIHYYRYGGPEEMRLEEFEPSRPATRQIGVRVKAASVNKVDWHIRNGGLKFVTGRRFPRAMGTDFAGVVEAVGTAVTRIKVGDEVFGTTSVRESGAFAESLVTKEELVIVKPRGLSYEEAACLPVVAVTAWRALVDKAHLKPGQSVFVNGCLGSVGRAAVQFATMLGANVAGSCRGTAIEEARALGVSPVLDFTHLELQSLTGRFDVVFDTPSTLSFKDGRSLLRRGGIVVGTEPTPATMLRSLLSRRYKVVFGTQTPDVLNKIAEFAASGRLRSTIGNVVPLSQAIQAITELERRGIPKGKLVIVPGR